MVHGGLDGILLKVRMARVCNLFLFYFDFIFLIFDFFARVD
jgi:hypothetical protein